ncbi:unnamed protein product, partial [Effrenium voratum]
PWPQSRGRTRAFWRLTGRLCLSSWRQWCLSPPQHSFGRRCQALRRRCAWHSWRPWRPRRCACPGPRARARAGARRGWSCGRWWMPALTSFSARSRRRSSSVTCP